MKKEIPQKIILILVTKLAWLIVLFLGKTARVEFINRGFWHIIREKREKVILVCWHGRMLLPVYFHRNLGINAMVSEHMDGEMIASTIERLGYKTTRGSSTRGGSKALRQMAKSFRQNPLATILPDGPNGPRQHFKMGAVSLAQISGAHILPVTFSGEKIITLKSWDRFTFWKPFSRLALFYGKPLKIPRKTDTQKLEEFRVEIENRLNTLQEHADAFFRK